MKWILFAAMLLNCAYAKQGIDSKNVGETVGLDLTKSGIYSNKGNDIWGWTDPSTGMEVAIMGLNRKTSFVDVTDSQNPVHLADIKTETFGSTWRDIKVYKDHAYIVSEAYSHGMQIFDLKRLRDLDRTKVHEFRPDKVYENFGSAHNISINEETGYAYAVGTSTCDGGLHIINIKEPKSPKFVTCVGRGIYEVPRSIKHGDAYTHDVQCVIYKGEDIRYLGREICIASNEDTVNVVDVTDKSAPYQITAASYEGVKYTHQGWLTEDHKYFLLGDELDEQKYGVKTKTFIWDFSDLEDIKHFAVYEHATNAIDHNMYVKGNYVYQANYTAGVRILDLTNISQGLLTEVGYMDPMPNNDKAKFEGVWSVFPYFDSGTMISSGINGTLYISKPNL